MDILRQLLEKAKEPFSNWRLGATTTILVCWLSFIPLWFDQNALNNQVASSGDVFWQILSSIAMVATAYTGTLIIRGSPSDFMRYAFLFSSLVTWTFTAVFIPPLAPFLLIFGAVSIAAFGMQYPKQLFWPFGIFLVIMLIPIGRATQPLTAVFLGGSLLIFLVAAQRLLAVREIMINLLDKEVVTQRLALQQQSQRIREQLEVNESNLKHIDALKQRYEGLKQHVAGASKTGQLFMRQATLQSTGQAWLKEALTFFPAAMGQVYYQIRPDARLIPLAAAAHDESVASRYQTPLDFSEERINQAVISPDIWVSSHDRHCLIGFRDVENFAFFMHMIQPKNRAAWTRDDIAWLRLISTAASGSMSSHLVRQERDALRKQDQVLNQVMGEIHRSLDVRTVLKTTAQQLGQSVNSPNVRIRILPPNEGGSA